MYKKSFFTLEFDKVLERIASLALSHMAQEMILTLEPFEDIEDINHALQETTEAVNATLKMGPAPIRGLRDIRASIKRLSMDGILQIHELLEIVDVLRATKQAKAYYHSATDFLDPLRLGDYFRRLEPLHPLYTEVSRCIISEEEIADDASDELYTIRKEMKGINAKIKGQLSKIMQSAAASGYLQDSIITMRNDRYCIPVKSEYRSQIKGMIHDQSSTGSTLFIEPLAIVELNNQLSSLAINEAKEIQKILAKLSALAASYHNELAQDIELLTHLDFVFAKANYSMNTKCSCPNFNTDYEIYLERARHPLLDPETVVPTTIYLGKEFTTLVVTGPNTGGKTVTLKTLGLLSLMGQCGLHIPAFDGAKLTVLDQIFADIGDEQSIEQSLSTFSSHMKNITYILEHVTDRSLVLFDELGAGTDPTEGAALAMAILDNLRNSRILTAATTHYSELKVYALSTNGVENASCEFDVTTLRPTYRLLIGIPGKSNAFAISKRLGLSDTIIDEAKALLEGKEVRFEDLITDLEANKKTAILEQERAKQYRKEAETLKDQVETQKALIAAQKKRMLEEAKNDAMKILDDAKAEADQIIRKMNDLVRSGAAFNMADLEEQRSKLREKINSASKKSSSPQKASNLDVNKLSVGDKVFVNTLGQNGTIVSISANKKEALIQMGIMKTTVPIQALELSQDDIHFEGHSLRKPTGKKYTQAKGNKSTSGYTLSKSSSIKTELDLRGTTLSEALELVDKYLDDAFLSHLPQVTLIHGKGTGALRQGIHQFLRTAPNVAEYRLGNYGEGESGVTVVIFKE